MSRVIKNLRPQERPRERCIEHGAECLSIRELLAVVIGSGPKGKGCLGLAEDLINRGKVSSLKLDDHTRLFDSLKSGNALLLSDMKGLGVAGKARLMVPFEFARRYLAYCESQNSFSETKYSPSRLKKLAEKQIKPAFSQAQREWIGFIPIYSPKKVGELCLVERGTRSHVNFDPKNLFSKLFVLGAPGFFLVHNHPAGTTEASEADHVLTQQIQILGKQLNTYLIDHCIVSPRAFSWVGAEA